MHRGDDDVAGAEPPMLFTRLPETIQEAMLSATPTSKAEGMVRSM